MKWALVSVEDKRFYEHHGVDWKGTLRAAVSNTTGADTQGASTLTQQYVKNYLINVVYRNDKVGQEKAQEQSIARKLKEARIAIQLETKLTKEQILAGYLNIVEFSRQIFGIGAAAHAYFNTTPKELDRAQAALLAGLVNNPINNDPWKHPEQGHRAPQPRARPDGGQHEAGQGRRRPLQGRAAGRGAGRPTKPAANCIGAGPEYGFFCQYVEDYLLKAGMTKDELYTGGYTIKTTLDERANHEAKVSAEDAGEEDPAERREHAVAGQTGQGPARGGRAGGEPRLRPGPGRGQTTYALPAGVYNTGGAGSRYKIFTSAAALEKGVGGHLLPRSRCRTPTPRTCSPVAVPTRADRDAAALAGTASATPVTTAGRRAMTLQNGARDLAEHRVRELEDKLGSTGPGIDMASGSACATRWRATLGGGPVNPDSTDAGENLSQAASYGPNDRSPGYGAFTLGSAR